MKNSLECRWLRFIIGILIPIIALFYWFSVWSKSIETAIYFSELTNATPNNEEARLTLKSKFSTYFEQLKIFNEKIEGLNPLIKISSNIYGYPMYAKFNDPIVEDASGKPIKVVLRIDIDGKYVEIQNGGKKRVVESYKLTGIQSISHSFKYLKEDNTELPSETTLLVKKDSKVEFSIEPTLFNLFITTFAIFGFWYALLFLISGLYRFVAFGEPFIKT